MIRPRAKPCGILPLAILVSRRPRFHDTVQGSLFSAELAEARFNLSQWFVEKVGFDSSPGFFSMPTADHRGHFLQSAKADFSPSFIRPNSRAGISRSGNPLGCFHIARE